MKKFKVGAKGRLHLTEGVRHVLGYQVTSYGFHRGVEFEERNATLWLSHDEFRIPADSLISVQMQNPTLRAEDVRALRLEEGGFVIREITNNLDYYIQPHSATAIEGLDPLK